MKKIYLLLVLLQLFLVENSYSQYCGAATTNVAITPTTTNQVSAIYTSGRRAFNFAATAGCTYYFETCGLATQDTYLRLYSTGTGGTVLATGDDNCGAQSAITWTCATSGTYSILLTRYLCNALSASNTQLRYRINSCAAGTAPCTNATAYGTLAAPTVPGAQTISPCTFQSEYNTITGIVAGQSYTIGSSCGGYISVRRDTPGGTVVGHGAAPYTFTAPTSGTYYIHYNTNSSCGTAATCCTTTITCNSCAAAYNPCASIPTISGCGTSATANMTGTGAGWSVTSCGFATPGQERLFQFTAPTTGTYTLNVSAITGGYVDFFWKPASGGCNATGWNCIDDISFAGAWPAITPMTFTAGTTYYILLDPEGTGTYSATFNMVCPVPATYDPCASIPTISGCGTSATANMTGAGAGWSPGSCGYTTPGQERLFSFTAPTTGTYTLNVSAITGGFVDFFWKPASGGCNATGWNCIDDIVGAGTYNAITPMTFTAGTTYYILLDPEVTTATSATFNMVCPVAGPANDLVCSAASITCGGTVSGTTIGAGNAGTGENQTCGTAQTMGGVWYVVPGNGQIMTASLCGTVWDSKISVFSGPNCSTLTCVGGNDDIGPACATSSASYSWTSVVGQNYYILVHGFSSNLAFSLALTCAAPPPADPTGITSSNASICSGAGTNVTLTATGASGTVYWFTGTCATTGQIGTGNSIVVSPTATTTYFARNYNGSAFSNNCASFTLTVNPLPTINAGTGGTICAGNNIQLNASSTSQTNGTLSTIFTGGNGCGAGNMFDLVAGSAPVTVNGFTLNPAVTGAQTVNVYYRVGTHVGNTTNIAAWTLLGAYTLNGTAATASYMATGNIVIPAGTTYGIYVQYNANYTDGNGTNQTYSNANLTLNAGVGHCAGFDGCCAPRVFNGIVHYTVGATTTISWSPSASLSSSSILNPVATPATTTTYTVTATANGCSASSNVTVTIEAASTAPALTGTSPVCPLTSVVINAAGGTASPGSTINWYTGANGTGSFLGTGSSYTVTPSATTTYYARREGGCNTTSDGTYTITVNGPTGIAPSNGDMVWRGASTTDWATLGNWWQYNGTSYGSASAAPTDAQNVIIPANQTCVLNQPNTFANGGNAKSLLIESGAELTMGNGTLSIAENMVNNGTFTPGSGTIAFIGSGNHSISGSSLAHNFNNVTMNKAGEVQLSVPIAITGTLTLTNGRLDIGNSNLDLPTNTINGGNASSYVKTSGTGTLNRDVAGIPVSFPVGRAAYNPATLTNIGTADKFSVRVIDNVTDDGTAVGTTTSLAVVNRTWMISEQNAGGSDVTLGLNWNGAPEHIGGFQAASAFIAHYISSDGLWDNIGGAVATNTIETSGITSFSPFTISSDLNFAPLPVELMSFSSVCLDNDVAIKWTTASENNSMHFVVETSTDAANWEVLSVVPAAQFSTSILNYAITHEGAARNKNYYRLKQVDLDGAVEFFNVIYANCGNVAGEPVVFPNPSSNDFTIDFSGAEMKGDVQLSILNTEGKEISNRGINLEEGVNTYQINNMELQPGIYYLKIVDTTGRSFIIKHSFI